MSHFAGSANEGWADDVNPDATRLFAFDHDLARRYKSLTGVTFYFRAGWDSDYVPYGTPLLYEWEQMREGIQMRGGKVRAYNTGHFVVPAQIKGRELRRVYWVRASAHQPDQATCEPDEGRVYVIELDDIPPLVDMADIDRAVDAQQLQPLDSGGLKNLPPYQALYKRVFARGKTSVLQPAHRVVEQYCVPFWFGDKKYARDSAWTVIASPPLPHPSSAQDPSSSNATQRPEPLVFSRRFFKLEERVANHVSWHARQRGAGPGSVGNDEGAGQRDAVVRLLKAELRAKIAERRAKIAELKNENRQLQMALGVLRAAVLVVGAVVLADALITRYSRPGAWAW